MRPTLELVDKTVDFKRDNGKAYLVPGSRRMICRGQVQGRVTKSNRLNVMIQ